MEKIKVLHIIKSLGRGGAEMLLPETLKVHDTSKFEFHYIYFLPWKNQMVAAIEETGGKVVCLPAKNNFQLILQYPKIIKYCREHKIQLIHAHLPWAGFVSRLVHGIAKIPTLYTEHNMQERYHFLTKIINKLSFNSQTMAIGVSDDVSASITKNIAPEIPVKTILNGVNTEVFRRDDVSITTTVRSQFGIESDDFLVGTVAVFRFQKRLDKWLEIVAQANTQNPKIKGIIVGAGPLENEIYAKHKALNLEGKVFFAGLQTNVKPYFKAMDVFMMASSFEGLPIALLEAMSMGCAVVSTEAGGIKEVIRNTVDGKTVAVDNWPDLGETLMALSHSPDTLAQLQRQARKRVEEHFSIQAMVNELESYYLKFAL
ncbi:glycosyltransferase [Flavobacterium enshiense]|uniref:glycosyltransferase n=1 Tax=Flavobacterium enshiense TaxID=1341165 RepID=UPI00345D1026